MAQPEPVSAPDILSPEPVSSMPQPEPESPADILSPEPASSMPQPEPVSAPFFLIHKPPSAHRREHDIENVDSSPPNFLTTEAGIAERELDRAGIAERELDRWDKAGIAERELDRAGIAEWEWDRAGIAEREWDRAGIAEMEIEFPPLSSKYNITLPEGNTYSTTQGYYTTQESATKFLSTEAATASDDEELLIDSSSQMMEQHVVRIRMLSDATEDKLNVLPRLSSSCCIYTVPDRMKYSNERHYTPRVVSIGPIHHHNEKLKANQHLKEKYLEEFLQLTGVSLFYCYKLVLNRERKLRKFYADVIDIDSENFVEMVLVDAAFLLMILVYNYHKNLIRRTDRLFKKPKIKHDIFYDMMLLENQLPFFILEDLCKLSKLQSILERAFNPNFGEKTAMTFLGDKFCKMMAMTTSSRAQPCSNALHILDMFRSYLIPADWTPERKKSQTSNIPNLKSQTRNIPNLKELHQAGVKIQVGSEENMFDIRFQQGILKVPRLFIDKYAEVTFRNLLAFELCHCGKNYFADYFEMMRHLSLTSEDAKLLIQYGVIDNLLPNAQQVSTLFQNIDSVNVINWSEFLYSDVMEGLNEYYKHDWHKWKATLKEKYFKPPWAIFSVSVAAILLVLTIIQTVFTILQVALPK